MTSGRSLVGLLVSVGLVVVLAVVFAVGSGLFGEKSGKRKDGKGETVIGKSMYAAKDDVCRSNLGQVRQSLEIAKDPVEGTNPESLEETKLGNDFYKCPVGSEPYEYDKATGQVKCVHVGHEKY